MYLVCENSINRDRYDLPNANQSLFSASFSARNKTETFDSIDSHNDVCRKAGALLIYAHRDNPVMVEEIKAILEGRNVNH